MNKPVKSALKTIGGINAQQNTDINAVNRFKKIKRKKLGINEYTKGILQGEISVLSKAITLIESSKPEHQDIAQQIIENTLPYSGKSIRIGITGVPGVGKSTFIESLGTFLLENGHKLAVLAIDPSSKKTRGSILGDKTRMDKLSKSKNAFIRPSPSSGTLGGVARKTRESIILCEAAGFDIILIETVGVGQSETAVYSMVDFFLLLMLAGAGDELQGIKRGIMEMADCIIITKADSNNIDKALKAQAELHNAIHFFPKSQSGWQTKVMTCSAKEKKGIDNIWENIDHFKKFTVENGFFFKKRQEQTKYWMYETIHDSILNEFYNREKMDDLLLQAEKNVVTNKISPFKAAIQLLDQYLKK